MLKRTACLSVLLLIGVAVAATLTPAFGDDIEDGQIYRIIRSLPEHADRTTVLRLLSEQEAEVRHIFRSHAEPKEGYRIRQISVYGITECLRADMAAERLADGDIEGFGELMNLSHDADRVTRMTGTGREPADNSYPDRKIDRLPATPSRQLFRRSPHRGPAVGRPAARLGGPALPATRWIRRERSRAGRAG